MSYTMVRRFGRREAFGDAQSDAQTALEYGRTVASVSSTIGADTRLRDAMSPSSYAMLSTYGTVASSIVQKISGGEDPGQAMAEQIAFLIADMVVSLIKDVVKDLVSVVPVFGPIINVIIDAAAGAARLAASSALAKSGRTGDQAADAQRASDCMTTTVVPRGYPTQNDIHPADILTSHSGDAGNLLPDLGRAILAIVNPTPADLEAVQWFAGCWQNGCNRDAVALVGARLQGTVGYPSNHPMAANKNALRNQEYYRVVDNAVMCRVLGGPNGRWDADGWDAAGWGLDELNAWKAGLVQLFGQIGLWNLRYEVRDNMCVAGRYGPAVVPVSANVTASDGTPISLVRSNDPPRYAIPDGDRAVMSQIITAIQSQYMLQGSSGGVELWPLLMDLLLHQIKSGNINDNAIAVILSRHSADNCFDFNDSIIKSFYGAIDGWNASAHPVYKQDIDKAAKAIADSQQYIVDWVNKNVDVSQRKATLLARGVKLPTPMVLKLPPGLIACVKAKGKWDVPHQTCTTTRAGVVWSPKTLTFVPKPLMVVKKSSPLVPLLFGVAAVGSIAWMSKHRKKRATT